MEVPMKDRIISSSDSSEASLMIKSESASASLSVRLWTKDRARCLSSLVIESLAVAVTGILMKYTGLVDEVVIEFVAKPPNDTS
jgi:hypothetical protein